MIINFFCIRLIEQILIETSQKDWTQVLKLLKNSLLLVADSVYNMICLTKDIYI